MLAGLFPQKTTTMLDSNKAFYRAVFNSLVEVQALIPDIRENLQNQAKLSEVADTAYTIRRAFDLMEEQLKQLRALKTLSEKILCMKWALGSDGSSIKTEYCTATPEVNEMAKIPSQKNQPSDYCQFLADLGCPDELIKADALRPHWPGLIELFKTRHAEGKPLPKGVDPSTTYPVYSVRFLKKKGVIEEE